MAVCGVFIGAHTEVVTHRLPHGQVEGAAVAIQGGFFGKLTVWPVVAGAPALLSVAQAFFGQVVLGLSPREGDGVAGEGVLGHPDVLRRKLHNVARAKVAWAQAFRVGHPFRGFERSRCRDQRNFIDGDGICAGCARNHGVPFPAGVAGYVRLEAVGGHVGLQAGDANVVADFVVRGDVSKRLARRCYRLGAKQRGSGGMSVTSGFTHSPIMRVSRGCGAKCCKMGPMAKPFAAFALLALLPLSACGTDDQPEQLIAVVQQRYDFDPTSFTQGLEVGPAGELYVGTGWNGESRVYRRDIDGTELASQSLPDDQFGEGISLIDATLWQLTWQSGVAYKRDAETLEVLDKAAIDGEGWGICHLEATGEVIFSDGTAQLRRMDPETLEERERFNVTLAGTPVDGLNELECVGSDVYANVFTTTDIVRIDAETGNVTAVIDASGVPNNAASDLNNVLNGIAHIPDTEEFYVTGKRWPDLYRVTFEPAD